MVMLTASCNRCPKENNIEVFEGDLRNYVYNKQLVQNVWPELTASDREIIMGAVVGFYYCDPCWNKCFGED